MPTVPAFAPVIFHVLATFGPTSVFVPVPPLTETDEVGAVPITSIVSLPLPASSDILMPAAVPLTLYVSLPLPPLSTRLFIEE